jgi:ABC-type Fe3+/spermidine/putrescine transport system ATPase subunit
MTAPALRCKGLTVRFDEVLVLDELDLEIARAETVALLGPSGSGKTTLLYAIAGLLEPDAGEIEIDGKPVGSGTRAAAPELRSVGMVFQNYALWPHLSAVQTVAYPIRRRGISEVEAAAMADRLLATLGIGDLADRLPDQLSGGQQQRVGLARALAAEPALFLFDEPTAHLDAALRITLQQELMVQRDRVGASALYTTHDAAEALAVGDRVGVLRNGKITQIGRPAEIYCQPVDLWTARLTGSASLLRARAVKVESDRAVVDVLGTSLPVPRIDCVVGEEVDLLIRPEWAELGGPLEGVVERVRFEGPHTDYLVATAAGLLLLRHSGAPRLDVGEPAGFGILQAWALPVGSQAAPSTDQSPSEPGGATRSQ